MRRSVARNRGNHNGWLDDLRAGYDPDDDDLVRERLDHARRRSGGDNQLPELHPALPARNDEILCRSCRLYVRREFFGDAVLLICRDCRR